MILTCSHENPFEDAGFHLPFDVIEEQKTLKTADDVMTVFESVAAAGYKAVRFTHNVRIQMITGR